MYGKMKEHLCQTLAEIKEAGLYKNERLIESPQQAEIQVAGKEVLNFCANNYLGLSNHPRLIEAAKKALDSRGFGMSSVRFICGTADIHKVLEAEISEYFKTEDTILYAACFDANGGVFEPLLTDEDAIISDALNHASIIDGVRLCKAKRYRYANANMEELEKCLQEAQAQRFRIIVTDGVFSMDGNVAPMDKICDLAEKYDALVMVDESHSAGVVGATGHGVSEFFNTYDRVDIYTGTLGKSFGGAMGGFTTGKKEIIDLLRQRSRPYLFSNTLAPAIAAGTLKVLEILENDTSRREKLFENTRLFAEKVREIGLDAKEGGTPIIPIMLYDEHKAVEMAKRMMEKGVYAVAFSYPVVPKGKARIRTQISAALSKEDVLFAANAFREAKEEMGI
jgi:glycine C-acetyltransferase